MALTSSSRTERFKQGKALRHKTPREAHADLKGSLSRNAVALLAESDRDRVPELIPERYARMSLNPFAFLRGPLPSWRPTLPPSRWLEFRCRRAATAI
jgi:hypothetical protein